MVSENGVRWEVQRLIDIGFLVPVDSIELYHGRTNKNGEEFRVDPTRAGIGSTIPNISLATNRESAEFVSEDRSKKEGGVPEVHRFDTIEGGCYFINTDMDLSRLAKYCDELTQNQRVVIKQSVKRMEDIRVGEGAIAEKIVSDLGNSVAVEFYQRQLLEDVYEAFINLLRNQDKGPFIMEPDIDNICETIVKVYVEKLKGKAPNTKLEKEIFANREKFIVNVREIVTKFAGAINARIWLFDNPGRAILGYMSRPNSTATVTIDGFSGASLPIQERHFSPQFFETVKDKLGKKVPMNWDYYATWLTKNNIVGGISTRNSDTVGGETLPVYFGFDLDRLKTEAEKSEIYEQTINKYGELLSTLTNVTNNGEVEKAIIDATPEQCIEFINKNKTYPNIADMPAHVHEGYTVGEHTEAALRLYQENYARTLPEDLQPFMKLSILLHDIGKGFATAERAKEKGRKAEEQEETNRVCKELFKEFGFDSKVAELISFVIGESQTYTTMFYIMRQEQGEQMLLSAIKNKYKQIFGVEPTEAQVNGIASMSKILQFCDSYSYTPDAVIRLREGKKSSYVHGENNSFAENAVRGRHTLEYTRPDGGEHASDPYVSGKRKK